jgi:hypothetical protein
LSKPPRVAFIGSLTDLRRRSISGVDSDVAVAGKLGGCFREVASRVDASAFAAFQGGGSHQSRDEELVLKFPAFDRCELALRDVPFPEFQAVGRLAAAVKGGPDVVDLTVLPQGDRGPSGRFRLQISSGDVRLEQLRVSPWQTAEPVMGDPDMTRVALRGGRALAGDVVSLDAAGDLVVRGAAPGECEPGQLASRRGLKAG